MANNKASIMAPVTGQMMPITDVKDPVFSQKMMGDGLGIEPTDGQIVAPVSGTVMLVAHTGHALGFKTASGMEVLVHLGIDTVELNGGPFDITIQEGATVTAGDVVGTMSLAEIDHAGKQKTVITAITNTDAVLDHLTVKPGTVTTGDVAADVTLKTAQQNSAAAFTTKGESKYETLAKQIVQLVGGKASVNSVIHCITRVRFYLKDDHKADDEAIRNLDGIIDIAKSGGQYQVVIGPAVTEVYNGVIKVLGPEFSEDGDASVAAPKQVAPKGMWPATNFYFSQLIGVITGSMIPIIGLLAAAGILKGTLALATTFHWVSATSSTYVIVSAMGDSVFFFLPIFVGYRRRADLVPTRSLWPLLVGL